MKRRNWITAGIVCVLISGTAGTFALYQDTTAVQNHIRTGDISIGIQEYEEKNGAEVIYTGSEGRTVLPSQSVSKIPRITNYAQPCYLRVKSDRIQHRAAERTEYALPFALGRIEQNIHRAIPPPPAPLPLR